MTVKEYRISLQIIQARFQIMRENSYIIFYKRTPTACEPATVGMLFALSVTAACFATGARRLPPSAQSATLLIPSVACKLKGAALCRTSRTGQTSLTDLVCRVCKLNPCGLRTSNGLDTICGLQALWGGTLSDKSDWSDKSD